MKKISVNRFSWVSNTKLQGYVVLSGSDELAKVSRAIFKWDEKKQAWMPKRVILWGRKGITHLKMNLRESVIDIFSKDELVVTITIPSSALYPLIYIFKRKMTVMMDLNIKPPMEITLMGRIK